MRHAYSEYHFSLYMANGQPWLVHLLFAMQAYFGLCVAIGYRTRWSVFCSWILICSLQTRNILIDNGGDIYLRVLMFWLFQLPAARFYSVDDYQSRRSIAALDNAQLRDDQHDTYSTSDDDHSSSSNNNTGHSSSMTPYNIESATSSDSSTSLRARWSSTLSSCSYLYASGATFGLLLQYFALYRTSYLHKIPHELWSRSYDASFVVFNGQMIPRDWSRNLVYFPQMLRFATFIVLHMEGYFLYPIFLPYWRDLVLLIGFVSVFMLHFNIWIAMRIEAFPIIGMCASLVRIQNTLFRFL